MLVLAVLAVGLFVLLLLALKVIAERGAVIADQASTIEALQLAVETDANGRVDRGPGGRFVSAKS